MQLSRAWTLIRTALGVGLAVGCLWGSLQGIHRALEQRLLGIPALPVALETLRSALDARVVLCLTAAAAAALAFAVARAGLGALRHPPRDAALGSAAAALAVGLSVVGLRVLEEAGLLGPADDLEGLLIRVLVVQALLLLALGVWLGLRRRGRSPRACWDRRPGLRWIGAFALYWLVVHGAFHAANGWASRTRAGDGEIRRPVVLIGVDGVAWDVMDPLLERGAMPHVARLLATGARASLATQEPTLSPVIWTTIATGVPMSVHGITHFVAEGEGSRQDRLVTSRMRRVKALWSIAGERGRSVGIVGWLVTWPAEPVAGFVVSSYAGLGRTWKGRLQRGIPEQTWPHELFADLEPLMQQAESRLDDSFRQIFPRLDASQLNETQRGVIADTREVLLADMLNTEIGVALLRERAPDLFSLYLAGADVAGHRFWKYMQPDALPYRIRADDVAMLRDVVPNYYRFVDAAIGRVLQAADPDALVLLVSDHGMKPYQPADGDDDQASGHHEAAPPGILVIAGPGVRPGPLPVSASIYDVAPTVLHALGLPLAADMRGRPLLAAFREDAPRQSPPFYVASYEDDRSAAAPESVARETELDELLKQRLESLGYLR